MERRGEAGADIRHQQEVGSPVFLSNLRELESNYTPILPPPPPPLTTATPPSIRLPPASPQPSLLSRSPSIPTMLF